MYHLSKETFTRAIQEGHDGAAFVEFLLAHNRGVREKIEHWRTRVRHHALADLDESLAAFYARQITGISSLNELTRLLRDPAMQQRLCISEAELAERRKTWQPAKRELTGWLARYRKLVANASQGGILSA